MSRFFALVLAVVVLMVAGCGNSGPSAWLTAEQLEIEGKHDQALKKAMKAFDGDMDNMNGAALSQLSTDRYASVEKYVPEDIMKLTKAIWEKPQDADLYAKRGFMYAAINEFPLAIRDFDKALEIETDPNVELIYIHPVAAVRMCRAVAKWQAGDLDGALTDLDEVIRLNSGQDRAYYYRAIIKNVLGRRAEAIADLKQIVTSGKQDYYASYLAELDGSSRRGEIMNGTFLLAFFANSKPLNRPFGYVWMVNQ